jgi:predicted transcriptional regulator
MAATRKQTLGEILGPLESDTMNVAWDLGEVTVRDVHSVLNSERPTAYTTVLTTLGRLADKGLLRRIEIQPAHRYRPLVSRDQYAHSTAKSVIDWLIRHFPEPAVSYLVDRMGKEDEAIIDRLSRAIDERTQGGRG